MFEQKLTHALNLALAPHAEIKVIDGMFRLRLTYSAYLHPDTFSTKRKYQELVEELCAIDNKKPIWNYTCSTFWFDK